MTATDYDNFAHAYSAENEEATHFNAYYQRPEMLRLAGDVSGRRILDAGCGSGPLSAGECVAEWTARRLGAHKRPG